MPPGPKEMFLLEFCPRYAALADDGEQGADFQFGVIRNGYSHGSRVSAALHHDMASTTAYFGKSMFLKNSAGFST